HAAARSGPPAHAPRLPQEVEDRSRSLPVSVGVREGAHEVAGLDRQPGLLEELAAQALERVLALLEEAAGSVPEPGVGLVGPPREENTPGVVEDERGGGRSGVCVGGECA